MANNDFLENLKLLDFEINDSRYGLLFASDSSVHTKIDFEDLLILEQAKSLRATAVYVRRFSENQTSIPQVYIYDNTTGHFSNDDLVEIHRKIWTSGIVPIYYVFDRTQLRIFDARNPIEYKGQIPSVSPLPVLDLVSGAHKSFEKYSAKLFANGTFWEQEDQKSRFLKKGSAETAILEGLKKIRKQFLSETNLDPKIANRLLVLCILVKYLEERKDEKGNDVFPSDFFTRYDQSTCFCDVLRNGKVIELFNDLNSDKHFNGKIFEISDLEKSVIANAPLASLANYLDANNHNNQYVFWRLYSFEHLPVELISRIYEEFMPENRDDAVYTPVHLARLMVDECMPISEPKENFKVIDVSCGSGIFLVTVYKRLVQWWQKRQYEATGQLLKPDVQVLKQILLESIYGIDIEEEAVRLSVFSLSLALCDMLSPTEIWTQLKFENLRKKNIYEGNFFQYLKDNPNEQFSLVIGNPPFERYTKEKFESLVHEYKIDVEFKIPGNQIALLFLQKSIRLLKDDGLLSLILPSSSFLYGNSLEYRKNIFEKYNVPQIVDLTSLSSCLYNANVATCVLFAEKKTPTKKNIFHIIVRKTDAAVKGLNFEIDYYDINQVPTDLAKTEPNIWKANLLGGSVIFPIISRFDKIRTLGEYLKDRKLKKNWAFGEGYKRDSKILNFSIKNKADYLTGKRMVPTEFFDEDGIHQTIIEQSQYFESPRNQNKEIFKGPHILIKNALGKKKLPVHFVEEDLGFMREIIGIHAPETERAHLVKLKRYLKKKSNLNRFLIATRSGRAGVDRSIYTVKKEDFMALPYPLFNAELKLSKAEQIVCDDVLNYGLEALSRGETAIVNRNLANKLSLTSYSATLCDSLNPIYQNDNKKFYALEPIEGASFFCIPIVYGYENESFSIPTEKIKQGDFSFLLENKQEGVLYKRVLRLYQKDVVYLIKPKTLRYWLKSIALRDAGDIMIDLVNSGF